MRHKTGLGLNPGLRCQKPASFLVYPPYIMKMKIKERKEDKACNQTEEKKINSKERQGRLHEAAWVKK
jgi:hypothetical protein